MAIFRITARWSGFPGAPGYSTFHFQGSTPGAGAEGERARVRSFFSEFSSHLAGKTVITVEPTIHVFDDTTGTLVDLIDDADEVLPVNGPVSGTYAGPVGGMVQWNTGTVVNGKLLRGRTFIVPLGSSAYDSDGTLGVNTVSDIRDGAAILAGGGFGSGFGVWSRPSGGGSGAFAEVTSARVPDKAVVLRSRRD